MTVSIEIIKHGEMRSVGWPWYIRSGGLTRVDYVVGKSHWKRNWELLFRVTGLRIANGFQRCVPGMPMDMWVPLSVLARALDVWPCEPEHARTGAMLQFVLPASHNNQARFVAVLRGEGLLVESLETPEDYKGPVGYRAGYPSVRNPNLSIDEYTRTMLKRKPCRPQTLDVPPDTIWRPSLAQTCRWQLKQGGPVVRMPE